MTRIINIVLLVLFSIFLIGCGATTGGTTAVQNQTTVSSGFGYSLEDMSEVESESYEGIRLDVIVPVFDPGIPDDPDDYEKFAVWPEVRRTEAIRFASHLKLELQETRVFGDVRIAPDTNAVGDLYVLGEIQQSNGEDVKIKIRVYDVSGKRWMKKTYSHRAKEYHWQDIRQQGKDPYQPLFEKVAADVVDLLKKRSSKTLGNLRTITDLQFANVFVDGAFNEHLKINNKKLMLVSRPAANDPMLKRTQALRVADGLFMDKMQANYESFVNKSDASYVAWQEHSLTAAKQKRKAKSKAATQAILGGLLLLGAAVAAQDSDYDDSSTAAMAAAAVGGTVLLRNSFASRAEGKFHHDTLMELGQSLNFDVAQQVVELEDSTVTLRGNVQQQYLQWRRLLKLIYNQEGTPNLQI